MRMVRVELGERSYDVLIGTGLFKSCADFLSKSNYSRKALVITDQTVDKLYGEKFIAELKTSGFEIEQFVTVPGEEAKNLSWAEQIYTKAIDTQLDRKSPFIVLGGGVPGDLAGFAAATYMRGVPFLQVPTTLLAQVDSSVGGKVAVNHPAGKNMIGAFYQPEVVFADVETLKTLSGRDYASGLAEVVKYACLGGEQWLDFLESNIEKIKNKDEEILIELVARCCEYKAMIVAEDEREGRKRMYLNFGHTYGHAVETIGRFAKYSHGEAVAIGTHGALLLSEKLCAFSSNTTQRVLDLLNQFSLLIYASGIDSEKTFAALWHDKKALGGSLQWVLLGAPGDVRIEKDIDTKLIREVLTKIIK